MKLSREERTTHVDLTTECQCVKATASRRSLKPLRDYLGLENDVKNRKKDGGVIVCHLCPNNSSCLENLCVNPRHLYFGTYTENEYDKPCETRRSNAVKAAKSRTTESLRSAAKAQWGEKTEEEKQALLSKSFGSLTAEQRRLRSLKTAETKRLKKLESKA